MKLIDIFNKMDKEEREKYRLIQGYLQTWDSDDIAAIETMDDVCDLLLSKTDPDNRCQVILLKLFIKRKVYGTYIHWEMK